MLYISARHLFFFFCLPVFQAILLFLCLGQIPLELFSRKPELLD